MSTAIDSNDIRTLNEAIARARDSMQRTDQAAKHCIGGPAQKARLQATAAAAAQRYRDLDVLLDSYMRMACLIERCYDHLGKVAQLLNALGREDRANPLRATMNEIKSPMEAMEGAKP